MRAKTTNVKIHSILREQPIEWALDEMLFSGGTLNTKLLGLGGNGSE